MMKYLCAGLAAALFLVGGLYWWTNGRLADAKVELAAAEEANEAGRLAISRLERSIATADNILAAWNEDRTTLAQVRAETRKAVNEAMRDEAFKAWVLNPAPADAFRLWREAVGQD